VISNEREGLSGPPKSIALLLAQADERPFEYFRDGVEVSWIYGNSGISPSAAFLRYAPGAHIPRHRHEGLEHILILRGSQQDERGVYAAGTFVVNPPGSAHDVSSPDGCLVLIIWAKSVHFVTEGV
jgi:anti-sigma factor ChrR (cupin superfamily)